jgi:hypothetical protein
MRAFDMFCYQFCQVVRRSLKPHIGKLELRLGLAYSSDLDLETLLSQRILLRDLRRERVRIDQSIEQFGLLVDLFEHVSYSRSHIKCCNKADDFSC